MPDAVTCVWDGIGLYRGGFSGFAESWTALLVGLRAIQTGLHAWESI